MGDNETLYFKIVSSAVPAGLEWLTVRALDQISASMTVSSGGGKVYLCELVKIDSGPSFLGGFGWRVHARSWFRRFVTCNAIEISREDFMRRKQEYERTMRTQYLPPVISPAIQIAE